MDIKSPIAIVAGMGRHTRAIGRENGLIWTVPDDLRRFARLTRGNPVVLGRKTFESIIQHNGGPLIERPNVVLTRDVAYEYPGAIVASSLQKGLQEAYRYESREVHIGGGSELYDQAMPLVERLYLTFFRDDSPGDTFFPEFESDFQEIRRHGVRDYQGLEYEWVDYVRSSN